MKKKELNYIFYKKDCIDAMLASVILAEKLGSCELYALKQGFVANKVLAEIGHKPFEENQITIFILNLPIKQFEFNFLLQKAEGRVVNYSYIPDDFGSILIPKHIAISELIYGRLARGRKGYPLVVRHMASYLNCYSPKEELQPDNERVISHIKSVPKTYEAYFKLLKDGTWWNTETKKRATTRLQVEKEQLTLALNQATTVELANRSWAATHCPKAIAAKVGVVLNGGRAFTPTITISSDTNKLDYYEVVFNSHGYEYVDCEKIADKLGSLIAKPNSAHSKVLMYELTLIKLLKGDYSDQDYSLWNN